MFSLRIDIDARKGLIKGVPKLLKLLKEKNVKASFYIPVGGESTLAELLKYRGGTYGKSISKYGALEKFRIVCFPINFAERHVSILKRIRAEGHELGVHGWKHRAWARALDEIDLDQHFTKMVAFYEELLDVKPTSFAAPGFRTNQKYLEMLDEYGFQVASDLEGTGPFHPKINGKESKHVQVPITLRDGINPIIESLVLQNKSDQQIIQEIKKKIDRSPLATIYGHAEYECIEKLDLLEAIINYVKDKKIPIKTISEIAQDFR